MDIQIIASGSRGNCYRVSDGKTAVLLDAGIPYKEIQKALNFKVRDIAGVLVTHEHLDHCKAVDDLAKNGIDIYASSGTFNARNFSGHRMKVVKALNQFKIDSFTVLPFDTEHDCEEPLGFLLQSDITNEKLLYFTDTYYLKYTFTGLTYIIGECNYSMDAIMYNVENGIIAKERVPRLLKSHMSLEHFMEFIKANDMSTVRTIYLAHMSSDNGSADKFKEAVQRQTGVEVYVC